MVDWANLSLFVGSVSAAVAVVVVVVVVDFAAVVAASRAEQASWAPKGPDGTVLGLPSRL